MSSAALSLQRPIQTLSVGCCVAMAMALLPSAYQGELFAWHPLMFTLGFVGFMTEGIMTAVRFRPNEGTTRVAAITNHALIQCASTACCCLGFYAIFHNKNLKGKQHFTSLHGKVGLVTFLLSLASPLLGALSFRRLGLVQRLPEGWQPQMKWLHRLISAYAYVMGMVTMQLPLPHSAVLTGAWCRLWQAGIVSLGACMLYVLRGRISGRTVLPSSGASAPSFHTPKNL